MENVRVMSASTLIGDSVKNPQGEDLGNLKEIMLDVNSGNIAYAVLSFGGFLGMGDKLFAIPWEAFTVNTEKEHLVLNIDKERLKDAPGFDKDNWPKTPNSDYVNQVHSHYGYKPYWERQHSYQM
jgi:sporulation protein YlmC with PRC-barrel domain